MGNKLSSFGTNGTVSYDAAGNVTNAVYDDGRELSLTWNGAYRLTSVANTGTVIETYGYDALGRRVWISDGTETNQLVYAGPHVVAETDSAGTLTRSYTYGPGIDNILSMTVYGGGSTSTYWYVTDHLNTVWALVDATGNVVESYDYDAFGNVHAFDESGTPISESAVGNRYLFQRREYSWVTGLYYFRARWYEPIIGQWLSNDPIGISGGLNQYAFCGNDPVNRRDPLGLQAEWFPTVPDVPSGTIFSYRFDMPAFPCLPLPSLSDFRWHGLWGGPGWTAGQWKPESSLVPSDLIVAPIDARDRAYREHDVDICERRSHSPFDDMRLGWNLLHVPPWQRSFWMTSRWVPMPAPVESLFWFTGLPGFAQ